MLIPKLFTTLRAYDQAQFKADLAAGVIVGIVALPLAIAFAIASGVTPDRGLVTAIVAGFLISVLGGSRVQIGGPTGAFVVIVFGVVQKFGVNGLIIATMMAGVLLVALGVARLGSVIKFVPHPVIIGFTSGIAVIIFSGEIRDFLGLQMDAVPADFVQKWTALAQHIDTVNPYATALSALTIAIVVVWPRVSRKVPGPFVALIAATVLVQILDLPVETIGTRFGAISARLPQPNWPHTSLAEITALIAPAFTIAMLGAVESLLSAVVSDGMIGARHRSNMELVAQGVANIVAPIFGGIPATGAIARTATNVKSGGRTPVAGIVHAITLLLIALFFGRRAAQIPLAALAGILVIVAYNMSEWRSFVGELAAPKSDVLVLLLTFGLTVLVDLTVAIEVGMVTAALLFMKRMADVTNVVSLRAEMDAGDAGVDPFDSDPNNVRRRVIPKGVEIFEINGPLFFGAAEVFTETLRQVASGPKVFIVRMRNVPAIDSTGLHALKGIVRRERKAGALVLLSGIQAQPLSAIKRSALFNEIGADNIVANVDEALARARAHLGLPTDDALTSATARGARATPVGMLRLVPDERSDAEP